MKMLSVAVEDDFAKAIDKTIKCSGLYSSRSEFLKDSIRKNLTATMKMSDSLKSIREGAEKLASLARQRGFTGKLPSKREREKFAKEFIKEHGL